MCTIFIINNQIYKFIGDLLIGWFEPESKPAFENGIVPIKNWKNHLTIDISHWKPLWDKIVHRLPFLKNIQPKVYNYPDNFTPDGRWILGESPKAKNYFVAVDMNGNSLQGKIQQIFKHFLNFLDLSITKIFFLLSQEQEEQVKKLLNV